jgi:site-specific DNA-methyltransferase (adenine-specific)
MKKVVPVNQIIYSDCVQGMKALPDSCIPLTVTSPPYDGMRTYGGHNFDAKATIEQLWRITVVGGIVVWVVQDQVVNGNLTATSAEHQLAFKNAGFWLHDTIIMARIGRRVPAVHRYGPPEFAFVFSKGKPRVVNLLKDRRNKTAGKKINADFRKKDGRVVHEDHNRIVRNFGVRFGVWEYPVGRYSSTKDQIAFGHPAIMPEAMAKDLILSFSNPGELVFDPMAGAGTTCKMALLSRRLYLGFEAHKAYVEIARKRLSDAKRSLAA